MALSHHCEEAEVECLLKKAISLHAQAVTRSQAVEVYKQILRQQPSNAEAQHMLGALLIQLHGEEKYEEARSLVQSAINQRPACAKYRHSLGVIHRTCGRKREAVDAFERAIEKDPMNIQILCSLGQALRDVGRNMRAAEVWRSVTQLEPQHPTAHYRRATCLKSVEGRSEEALAALRQHQRLFPECEKTRFWIAAMSGDAAAMQAMPSELVAGLFDQYANNFDEHLVHQLQYRTPQLLLDAMLQLRGEKAHWQLAVDLGCGTGLMGPLLRSHVSVLEGVDLSTAMVEKARERGCYDRLAVAELVSYLSQHETGTTVLYDLLVAADVFVYIGDLEPVLKSAAEHSNLGAVFAFSCESSEHRLHVPHKDWVDASDQSSSQASDEVRISSYAITASGRYAHSIQYLETVSQKCGWRVLSCKSEIIRYNAGKPVQGHLCLMERVPQESE
jgi:predicted TPR repeat methyltransferase